MSAPWKSISFGVLSSVLLGLCTPVWSQGIYNETTLHIGDVDLFVDGSVINAGVLTNDGNITFTNNWSSKGLYEGSGTLHAGGNGTQRIAHHRQQVSGFHVSGWGTKYIHGTLKVADLFRLTSGVVHVSADDRLMLLEHALVEGGSSESYVEGALTVAGKGHKFLPVGKNGTYAPIELLDVKGEKPEYSVEVFTDAPALAIDGVIVNNALYWLRTDLEGDFGGSPVAVHYDPTQFGSPDKITMLAGAGWDDPFLAITQLRHSSDAHRVSTGMSIVAPIIMLGEISHQWAEADFYFPTALSPNANNSDNRNVKIFGDRLSGDQFRFVVFNRWGSVVYESASLESMRVNGWDGRATTGEALTSGTYPYKLTALDKTGKKFEKNGVITIIY